MILCSVCQVRISSAPENDGPFPSDLGKPITDTCQSCAKILREAVTIAAKKIIAGKPKRKSQ